MLANGTYDVLNKLQRWLPALGVFYMALAEIWGFPLGEELNATVMAAAALMAATLEVSSARYYKAEEERLR